VREVGAKAGGTACWTPVIACPGRREIEREPEGKARKEGHRERQNRLETRPALGEREAGVISVTDAGDLRRKDALTGELQRRWALFEIEEMEKGVRASRG